MTVGKSHYQDIKAFCRKLIMRSAMAFAFVLTSDVALADAPATAKWTGEGDRNVLTDPKNWQCFDANGEVIEDAIPDSSVTTVSITGTTSFNCPAGSTPIWKTLTVSGTIELSNHCDWRGAGSIFNYVNATSTLNLKGYNLRVAVPNGNASRKITVTDDSQAGEGGEFHLEVNETDIFRNGCSWNNDNQFWFAGSVHVVKDGKGTYQIGAGHEATGLRFYKHSGGTTIHEGLLFLSNDAEGTKNETYYSQGNRPVFGQYGSAITIEAGATFDYKGIYDLNKYQMYINGGTFTNTRAPAHPEWGPNGAIVFGADSFINVARTAHIGGPFVLNGHTLVATIAANQTWHCRNGSATNGTVKVEGDGLFTVSVKEIIATDNVTYDIACAVNVEQPMSVSNYVARYTGTANRGTAIFKVFGTFTPVSDGFYPITMQNGSVIDLSGKTGTWSSIGTSGAVKFASGALVTLDVGERNLVHGECVLSWEEKPENTAFRITGTSITDTESARIEADGVYYDMPDADVIAVAHWVGKGERNNFDDPNNWVCTNMVGMIAQGAVPGERSSVFFDVINFDLPDTASIEKISTYQNVSFAQVMTLSTDCWAN
jgi:hypothetical protein